MSSNHNFNWHQNIERFRQGTRLPHIKAASNSNKVFSSGWVDYGEAGVKKVKIAGLDNKCQITTVFTATMSGHFLAPQLINKGTTMSACQQWDFQICGILCTHNHWCNAAAMKLCIEKIIVPYVQRKKAELKLPRACKLDAMRNRWLLCTVYNRCSKMSRLPCHRHCVCSCKLYNVLQPLDLSVKKHVKTLLSKDFRSAMLNKLFSKRRLQYHQAGSWFSHATNEVTWSKVDNRSIWIHVSSSWYY